MTRLTLVFAVLFLMLSAAPAIAAGSPAEETAATGSHKAVPEMAEAEQSIDLLPGTLVPILAESQPASTCQPLQCWSWCKDRCPDGCFCTGDCIDGECQCEEICF